MTREQVAINQIYNMRDFITDPDLLQKFRDNVDILQKLVDQTNAPTKKELIKIWNDLGYPIFEEDDDYIEIKSYYQREYFTLRKIVFYKSKKDQKTHVYFKNYIENCKGDICSLDELKAIDKTRKYIEANY